MILHDFPFVYKKLTNSRDKDGNTLVHSAALTGNARLFKVNSAKLGAGDSLHVGVIMGVAPAPLPSPIFENHGSSIHCKKWIVVLTNLPQSPTPSCLHALHH